MTTLRSTVLGLIEGGFLRDAAAILDGAREEKTLFLRVLRNHLDFHLGDADRARATAKQLLKERPKPIESSIVWETIGRLAFSAGEIAEGQKAFKNALVAASSTGDLKVESRLRASYAEAVLHCIGNEPATVEIPLLRRLAVHTGDPYSIVALHCLVAEIQLRMGSYAAAKATIEIGRAVLRSNGNLLLQARLEIICGVIAILESDYESALSHNAEALSCASKSGSLRHRTTVLGNIAHIKHAQGSLVEASEALAELRHRWEGGSQIALLATLMQVALAAGDFDQLSSLDEEISSLSANLDEGHYYGLWYIFARVKWLYRINCAETGLGLVLDGTKNARKARDQHLLQRMQLLAAEGLGRLGRSREGAALLAQSVNENADPSPEILGESWRVSGRLTALHNPEAAVAHFARAARVFRGIGNLTSLAEVKQDVSETVSNTASIVGAIDTAWVELPGEDGPVVPSINPGPTVASVSERIAALIELGSHPKLLSVEALSLIADTNAVSRIALFEQSQDGKRKLMQEHVAPDGPADVNGLSTVEILTGRYGPSDYVLVAVAKPGAAERTTLLAAERIIRGSLTIARAKQDRRERAALWADHTPEQQLGLVCASERMLELIKTLRRVADSNLTVLLTGETGVGKELFARALHQASPRQSKTFFPFNCTAVPRDMLDSQLFGHRRGAFTGAVEDGKGVIRAAAGGTLFLDEIGEMSMEAQPKLLRFLESGEILPLGESKTEEVDVRIVAATNADLEKLVTEGRFREDLYYRLNVLPIHIPPLRERREEIPALVEHFLERYGRELQKPMLRVAEDTLEYLLLYRWPGNVRQLANEIRRMAALAEPGAVLQPAQLSKDIIASRRTIPVQPSEAVMPLDQTLAAATEQLERAVIERALKVAEGRNDEAAKALGLSRKGLYLKRQRLGV